MDAGGQRLFEGIGQVTERTAAPMKKVSEPMFSWVGGPGSSDDFDWAADADLARINQEPLRARSLLRWKVASSARIVMPKSTTSTALTPSKTCALRDRRQWAGNRPISDSLGALRPSLRSRTRRRSPVRALPGSRGRAASELAYAARRDRACGAAGRSAPR